MKCLLSLPFGNDSYASANLRFLTIEQVLADMSEFVAAKADLLGCPPGVEDATCAVVLFGGSYGGMLAGWHRFKYPHLTAGALACGN